MSTALHRIGAEPAATKQKATSATARRSSIVIAVAAGLGLAVVLGGLSLAGRRHFP